MDRLQGSFIVLTGASGGIGAAIARRLARRGARLLLVGRSTPALEALRQSLPDPTAAHGVLAADLATTAGRESLRAVLALERRPVDALVNALGVSHFALLGDAPADEIEAQIETNVTAPILVTRLLLARLAPHARILNIGSSFGGIGYPGFSTYCASKFALRGFTEALRRELADSGVQVACLAPRATRTALNSPSVVALNQALGNATDPPELVAAAVERMLLARRMRDRAIGWPERLFLRINALFPALVDGALRKQLPAIKRFATTSTLS